VTARVRKDPASVYANVGVHAGVAIALVADPDDGDGAFIHIGDDGPDVIMDFADADSLELLSQVAAEGARVIRQREAKRRAAGRNAAVLIGRPLVGEVA
jgi:hypothetical protein